MNEQPVFVGEEHKLPIATASYSPRFRPQDLFAKLRRGDPLTKDEYAFMTNNGYLPGNGVSAMRAGDTVSPSEISAAGMFAKNAMRSNGMMHRPPQAPGANVIRWG